MFKLLVGLLLGMIVVKSCNKQSEPLFGNLQQDRGIDMQQLFLLVIIGLVIYKLFQSISLEKNCNISPPSDSCKLSCCGNQCDVKNVPPGDHKEFCKTDYDCRDCNKEMDDSKGQYDQQYGQQGWHMWRNYA